MVSVRPTSISLLPTSGPAAIAQQIPGPTGWPGPPGSMLPEAYDSFPKSDGILLHNDFSDKPCTASYGSSYTTLVPSSLVSGDFAPPGELAQFPGNPSNLGSHSTIHIMRHHLVLLSFILLSHWAAVKDRVSSLTYPRFQSCQIRV